MIKVPYNKIMAFTSYKHYVDIITQIPASASDSSTCKCYRRKITLKTLEQQLPKEFIRCHRGAVTHVLVDDPTRGYGVFIETMLSQ